jgi:hypothetical protein
MKVKKSNQACPNKKTCVMDLVYQGDRTYYECLKCRKQYGEYDITNNVK